MIREEWDKLTADEQWANYQAVRQPQVSWPIFGNFKVVSVNRDDQGNLPPPGIQGDMIPTWYDGGWWVNHAAYIQRRREKGEVDEWGREI